MGLGQTEDGPNVVLEQPCIMQFAKAVYHIYLTSMTCQKIPPSGIYLPSMHLIVLPQFDIHFVSNSWTTAYAAADI